MEKYLLGHGVQQDWKFKKKVFVLIWQLHPKQLFISQLHNDPNQKTVFFHWRLCLFPDLLLFLSFKRHQICHSAMLPDELQSLSDTPVTHQTELQLQIKATNLMNLVYLRDVLLKFMVRQMLESGFYAPRRTDPRNHTRCRKINK